MVYNKEYFYGLSLDEQVSLWNEFCRACNWEDEVLDNDMYGYELVFGATPEGLQELARAIHFGEYNYMDSYFIIRNGNITTFEFESDFHDLIDIDELINWLEEVK